jgi:hypothetical protein
MSASSSAMIVRPLCKPSASNRSPSPQPATEAVRCETRSLWQREALHRSAAIGPANLQSVRRGRLRSLADLRSFRDGREIADELAARAKVASNPDQFSSAAQVSRVIQTDRRP